MIPVELLQDTQVAEFLVGVVSGLILLVTLTRVPVFMSVLLAAASLAILLVLLREGVPGVVEHSRLIVSHLIDHATWLKGVVIGKLLGGLAVGVSRRSRRRYGKP